MNEKLSAHQAAADREIGYLADWADQRVRRPVERRVGEVRSEVMLKARALSESDAE
ncbi:hypothetical protein [Nocardiopsis sp. YSL2]|uniref:hypothetical protein n=1 Tax=Nocardiopsis sp. YSL2 TaxID=2939492 RepID=UPI0026F42373|nr:hypothetical protein [Nocardiopsis sp. YSL2]